MPRIEVSKLYSEGEEEVRESLFTYDLRQDAPPLKFGVQDSEGVWSHVAVREGEAGIDILHADHTVTSQTPDAKRVGHDYYLPWGSVTLEEPALIQQSILDGRDTDIYISILHSTSESSQVSDIELEAVAAD